MKYKLVSTCPYADVVRHDDGRLEVLVYADSEPIEVNVLSGGNSVYHNTFVPDVQDEY